MVGANAAEVMDLPHGVAEGKPATINVFPSSVGNDRQALSQLSPPRAVLHRGEVVARTEIESSVTAGSAKDSR